MTKPRKVAPTVTVSLRFTPERLKTLDAAARKKGISRTAYINIAVTNLLDKGL